MDGLLFPSELKKLHLEELRQLVHQQQLLMKLTRSLLVQVHQLQLQLRPHYDALSSINDLSGVVTTMSNTCSHSLY
jgi:hypothetical protein